MDLGRELCRCVPAERVLTRLLDRIAFANDASVYRLVPRAVVFPDTVDEVKALFALSRRTQVPMTFRAAGTSLSGQAVTDGVLVVLSRHWDEIHVEDDGRRVRVQPGITGGMVNRHLQLHRTKLGPDPASINACMMGGILANNSSGMCCGVEQNAYHTLDSMVFVLPDGVLVDSAAPDAAARLRESAPELVDGLRNLRDEVRASPELLHLIERKYAMKNTMGYSLNALVDYDSPLEILTHLMIGSEGTLGFIAEATLHTVPDFAHKETGLLFFDNVPRACSSIAPLRDSGARALELMDRASLRAIQDEPGMPPMLADLPARAAALLVEYQCDSEEELNQNSSACDALMRQLPLAAAADFTRDVSRQAAMWRVRKGLIPSVGAMRARGTSFIIEDVVFPVASLATGVGELQRLFADFHYADAILFGHAKDGNLHFVLTQSFQTNAHVRRYDDFMSALADLVAVRHGGALKAEHGTGRNMAPFVEREWGRDALDIMRRIKRLIDPDGLLNPGVILNDDPLAHVKDLKSLPKVEAEVDQCIECGFCERMCPSRELTLTPRQRIVVRREIARLKRVAPHSEELRELESDYEYAAVETCATDGMCALACPVSIDTGRLVKRLRRESHPAWLAEIVRGCAERFAVIEGAARTGLRLRTMAQRLGLPVGPEFLPAAKQILGNGREGPDGLYFPSCVSRILGGSAEPLHQVASRVAQRAEAPLRVYEANGLCCGLPFMSKGFDEAYRVAANRCLAALFRESENGALPVVCDSSPCAQTLKEAAAGSERFSSLRILDGIEYAHDRILRELPVRRPAGRVLIHPVCSVHRQQLTERFEAVAGAFSEAAEIPIRSGCCGFAGDRGFRVPELTAAALRPQALEIRESDYDGYYCSSRTCEIGLIRATGRPYRSFWHLLDETTG